MLSERCEHHPTRPTRLKPAIGELIVRVQAEYLEMPGLTLTQSQAQRLWGIDGGTCALVLTALVDRRFLRRSSKGAYLRISN